MELFLTIVVTHFIALLTPGTDFFLILKTLMQSKIKAARLTCMGIALGNAIILLMIYSSLFLLGKVNTELLVVMKWLGVLYFAYLAVQCFRAARAAQILGSTEPEYDAGPTEQAPFRHFLLGLGSSLLNPKNLMFYSVLVILIYPQYNLMQNILVCGWMVGVVLIWNLAMVKLMSATMYLSWLNQQMHYLYYLAGGSFIFFMLALILS